MNYLQSIRLYELEKILGSIPRGSRVLEIGSGAGWQAKALAERGYAVEAIDIAESCYAAGQVWPVLNYDGQHIPFSDAVFEVVFTSNTLEHISHIEAIQYEIRRVLKPTGIAVHIVPTASWRFWTNLTHYLFVFRSILGMLGFASRRDEYVLIAPARTKRSLRTLIAKVLFPPRHGERGSATSELWTFSRLIWLRLFSRTGWLVESYEPLGIFYTGYSVLGAHLSLSRRKYLSKIFGSATMVYIVRPKPTVSSEPNARAIS